MRVIPIENYRKLVCQQAWRAWRCLPYQTRVWIGIDDMIQHGMWQTHWYLNKSGRFDPKRSNEYITSLTHVLHNMYIRDYIEKYGSQKSGWHRVDGKMVSIQTNSLEAMRDKINGTMDDVVGFIPALYTDEDSIVQNMLTECFVVPALSKVFKEASSKLQEEIQNWFFHRKDKFHTKGKPFRKVSSEFRQLCIKENVTCDDCLHLIRSPKCLDSLSREISWIPYDLENPTIGLYQVN